MTSLGQELREKREARRISIEEIASATKIVPRYLEALEADKFDIMPGRFFIKGIIRTYARAIGLDEDEVLARYRAAGIVDEPPGKRHASLRPEPSSPGRAAAKPVAEDQALPAPKPEPKPVPPAPEPAPAPDAPPSTADMEPRKPPSLETEPDPAERLLVKPVPEEPGPSLLKSALAAPLGKRAILLAVGGSILVLAFVFLILPRLSRAPGESRDSETAMPGTVVTPSVLPPPLLTEPEPKPPAEEAWKGVTIEISFQAETWIQVYADGVLTVDGLFPPGATAKAQAAESLLIHVGNAGGFSFLLNGKPARPLGRSGQVITDVKITPDNLKDYLETGTPGRPAG